MKKSLMRLLPMPPILALLCLISLGACMKSAPAPTSAPLMLPLPPGLSADDSRLDAAVITLAEALLDTYTDEDRLVYLGNLARLQLASGRPADALATLAQLRALPSAPTTSAAPGLLILDMHVRARLHSASDDIDFATSYAQAFRTAFASLNDRAALDVAWFLQTPGMVFARPLEAALEQAGTNELISTTDALRLIRAHLAQQVHGEAEPHVQALIAADDALRYVIADDVLIGTPDGATLSAIVMRPREVEERLPSALLFTIYTDETSNRQIAKTAAARGYASVVADARGKRLSPDPILPYEHEVGDTTAVIDWISRQAWSNGAVGMYGGSYSGFAAWAASKRAHPALKTIVTSVAALPGLGLPMTNNIFLNANYGWAFYVTNNKTLDYASYHDGERWQSLNSKWYESGRPYRELDQIDGTPNPLLQRWLQHPSYDAYWQAMVPFGQEFARIDIPVLSITGYYDDGQISALHYLREHYRHKPDAEHYLVIGPYDHFGAQWNRKPADLRGYSLDPVAQFDTVDLSFQWLDHVLRGAPRPALLADRINYQVMGANMWRSAPSLTAMSNQSLRLYLSTKDDGAGFYQLAREAPSERAVLTQVVDLADRTNSHNDYYPNPIEGRDAQFETGLAFISDAFEQPFSVNGSISGELTLSINKRDLDLGVVLYEVMPDGRLFHLSYFIGRASHAADMSTRNLLTPGEETSLSFERSTLVSRQIAQGSRLLVVVDVNKNAFHQINYGTGRDVSDESVADATEPLIVEWSNASHIDVPIWR